MFYTGETLCSQYVPARVIKFRASRTRVAYLHRDRLSSRSVNLRG